MAKYFVTCDCYGFQKRYWDKGKTVELPDDEKPPKHFKPLNQKEKKSTTIEETPPKHCKPLNQKENNYTTIEEKGKV